VNAHTIMPPAPLGAPPADPRPRKDTFRQVRSRALGDLRQAHRLTASQERLLVELVLQADHRTAQVRGFTLAAWAEYLCEGRNTTSRALRALEAAGLVTVEGLKAGREGVVTVVCWGMVVRARPSDDDTQATAPERREPVQVNAPERREDRAILTRGPRHFDAKVQGVQALELEELKNPARGVAEPPLGGSVSPLRARAESDDVVTALGFAFPTEDLGDLLRVVDALRAEGIADTTLSAATDAALKAGARSLRKWWEPRVRDLHKGATKGRTTGRPATSGPATKADRPQADAWCRVCHENTGESLRPGHCHCDTTPAPAFGIVTHTNEHRNPQEPADGWGIVTHRADLVGAA